MRRYQIGYWGALGVAVLLSTAAQSQTRGVIELFTSQGCSSCPPADKLLGELAADPTLVTISMPVDYWDYIGWKDTLADPRHSARQRAYARQRGDRQVYTPQVVVNGAGHVLGSDKSAIERALSQSRRDTAILSLPLVLSASGSSLSVKLPAKDDAGTAEVWLYGIAGAVPVAVGRGENRGRTISYHNVARRWIKLGNWNGKAAGWNVPLAELNGDGIDKVAVIVQRGTPDSPETILGAATISLR